MVGDRDGVTFGEMTENEDEDDFVPAGEGQSGKLLESGVPRPVELLPVQG